MPKRKAYDEEKKYQGWCFTLNNYTEENLKFLRDSVWDSKYLVFGREIAPTTGTPHLQGYIFFRSRRFFAPVQKAYHVVHLIGADGTPAQNADYCKKDGDFEEFGTVPQQGKRNDIHAFTMAVKDASTRFDEETLLTEHSTMVARYPMYVDRTMNHFHPPEKLKKLENTWCSGDAGTGKSTWAEEAYSSYFVKTPNKWFDGYKNEECIIVEDLEPKHAYFISWFLKIWADYKPFTAEVKNSSRIIRPPHIVVTSNYRIDQMGWDEVTTKAVARRFEQKFFTEQYDWHAAHPEGKLGVTITPQLKVQT